MQHVPVRHAVLVPLHRSGFISANSTLTAETSDGQPVDIFFVFHIIIYHTINIDGCEPTFGGEQAGGDAALQGQQLAARQHANETEYDHRKGARNERENKQKKKRRT